MTETKTWDALRKEVESYGVPVIQTDTRGALEQALERLRATDLDLVDRLTDAEYDNWRACVRDDWPDMPEPTFVSTLDSWQQMPDSVRPHYADTPELVEPALLRLIATYGDLPVQAVYASVTVCVLTGADGENPDDCTTHEHAP